MSSYQGAAGQQDRAKAIVGVVAVHAALAFVILTGLNVKLVTEAVDHLKTFSLENIPPPLPVPTPPKLKPRPQRVKEAAGAPAKKAQPTPVVAPPPVIPALSPVPAAKIAGSGNANSTGAAVAGSGSGAGGTGNGSGGGGTGTYMPALKLTKIPNREYRRFAETGLPFGNVAISIRVNPDGSVSNCRVVRSSGNRAADSLMCQLTLQYIRFSPATDPSGRPVAQDVTWVPNWAPR